MDRLAEQGSVFTQAISSTSWTLPAHVSLLTGLPLSAHGVRSSNDKMSGTLETLAGSLSRVGYQTTGFYAGPFLHPSFGTAQGFDRYLDCTAYGLGGADAFTHEFGYWIADVIQGRQSARSGLRPPVLVELDSKYDDTNLCWPCCGVTDGKWSGPRQPRRTATMI